MNRSVWGALAASTAVVAVVFLGFLVLGSPGKQRLAQSDLRTVRALANLAQQINMKFSGADKVLPDNLEKLPVSVRQDPVTGGSFGYHVRSRSDYELCATFATDNRDAPVTSIADPWSHPKGDYCFPLDASQPAPSAPYYY
jgi:hypothetical protein